MRLIYLLVGLAIAPVSAYAADPKEVVSAVVKLDKGSWEPIFDSKPTALMKRYFTAAFNASWANAMTHNNEGPVLDGDPITGSQSVESVQLKSASTMSISEDDATVLAKVAVKAGGAKTLIQAITFTMKREGTSWKIDNITGPVDGTIRAYFRNNYGK